MHGQREFSNSFVLVTYLIHNVT